MTGAPDSRTMAMPFEWGLAARALHGQAESGDLHLVAPFAGGVLIAAVDGLGHGSEAAAAARVAVATLRDHSRDWFFDWKQDAVAMQSSDNSRD